MERDKVRPNEYASFWGRLPVPDYIAFDLETTGLSPDDDEILEVAMVRFRSGKPVERWSTLLNPGRSVPLKALRITSIDEGELLTSPRFSEVMPRIAAFRGDLPLVGHNSSFDVAFLGKKIEGFPGVQVYDTLELARIAIPGFKSYKLTDLAREMGVSLNEAHRAYDDAEVSGVIFAMVQERVRSLGRGVRQRVVSVMGKGWEPERIFSFGDSMPPMLPLEMPEGVSADREPEGAPGARGVAGTECDRVGFHQTSLADAGLIEGRFAEFLRLGPEKNAVVNIPALPGAARAVAQVAHEYAVSSGQRFLLVGFPESALPDQVRRAPVPEDYLCLRKFSSAMNLAKTGKYAEMDIDERRFLASLAVWGEETRSGHFSEIQIAGANHEVAGEIACPRAMECRSTCYLAERCHYLRDEAESLGHGAQAMRLERAVRASGIAAAYDRVIVWSAHEAHRVWQYSEERTDLRLLQEALEHEAMIPSVPSLGRLIACATKESSKGLASPVTVTLAGEVAAQIGAAVARLRDNPGQRLAPTESDNVDAGKPWADPPLVSRGLHLIERAAEALSSFALTPVVSSSSSARLSLVETAWGDDSRGPFLVARSVWPAVDAVRALGSCLGPPVLISDIATVSCATEGGRRLLGVDGERPALDLAAPSGFESDTIAVTVDARVPATGPAFSQHVGLLLRDLSRQVRKGLLALFPSRALIKDVHAFLAPELEKEGIVVYAQGIDGGRRVVEHLEEEGSIVLAASGGPSGEDEPVPSCLVVVKVPFSPPNPVDDVRRAELSRGGADGFAEVSVRPSSLAIRTHVEKMLAAGGKRALVFCDPRLAPGQSRWAAGFFEAFHDLPREAVPVQRAIGSVSCHLSGES